MFQGILLEIMKNSQRPEIDFQIFPPKNLSKSSVVFDCSKAINHNRFGSAMLFVEKTDSSKKFLHYKKFHTDKLKEGFSKTFRKRKFINNP